MADALCFGSQQFLRGEASRNRLDSDKPIRGDATQSQAGAATSMSDSRNPLAPGIRVLISALLNSSINQFVNPSILPVRQSFDPGSDFRCFGD
jgi:hypothetical protein